MVFFPASLAWKKKVLLRSALAFNCSCLVHPHPILLFWGVILYMLCIFMVITQRAVHITHNSIFMNLDWFDKITL